MILLVVLEAVERASPVILKKDELKSRAGGVISTAKKRKRHQLRKMFRER